MAATAPQGDTVLVISYRGMHLIRLGHPVTVESDPQDTEYDLYDPESGVSRYRGRDWEIIGLFPDRPLLTGRDGERPVLDADGLTVSVVAQGASGRRSSRTSPATGPP